MITSKNIKAQFAVEFVVLITSMFIVFLGVSAIIATKVLDAKEQERQKIAEDIAALVKNEIDLAKSVSDGYVRVFQLPNKVEGSSYDVQIIGNRELVVKYLDKEHVSFLPENIEGDIGTGLNEIRKVNGVLYLRLISECSDGNDNDGDGKVDLADLGCADKEDDDETDCGDGVCEGGEFWPVCGDCAAKILFMKDLENAISLREGGHVYLKGTLTSGTIPSSTVDDEFIVNNNLGNSVAIINLVTGDMVISGSLSDNQPLLTPSPTSDDFIVKDSDGNVVSYIDDSGNFFLKGTLIENANP